MVIFPSTLYTQPFSYFQNHDLADAGESSFEIVDIDQNGYADVFLTGENSSGLITSVFLNQGDTTFLNIGAGVAPVSAAEVAVADFNNDNWPDIAYSGVTSENKAVFYILINNQDSTFQQIDPGLPGIREGEITATDLNNDGSQDLFISGRTPQNEFIAKVYKNDSNLGFEEVTSLNFDGVYSSSHALSDFNLDGKTDIIYSGINENFNRVIRYYENAGGMKFTKLNHVLPALSKGSMLAFHANSDGYPDLFVSGKSYTGDYITKVYQNQPGGGFLLADTLEGVYRSSVTAADCNNDGLTDLAYQGTNNSDSRTILLYLNSNTEDDFMRDTMFGESSYGDIQWSDLNKDGKADLMLSGYSYAGSETRLWVNATAVTNNSPNPPGNPEVQIHGDSVILSWNHGTDDMTPKENLEYNLFLKAEGQNNFLVSPQADTTTGQTYFTLPARHTDTSIILRNLPDSRYYWGVQSVDQTGEGSVFSKTNTFKTCHGFSLGRNIHTCEGSEVTINPKNASGSLKWYDPDNPDTPFSTDSTVSFTAASRDTVWATLTDSYGCTQKDTTNIYIYEYPQPKLGKDTSLCFGDSLRLHAGTKEDTVTWYTMAGEVLAEDTNTFIKSWKKSGGVFVEVTNQKGCSNRDTMTVEVHPQAQWALGQDTSLCKYDSLKLQAPENYQPLTWNLNGESYEDSAEHVCFSVNLPLEVVLTAKDSNGCSSSDTLQADIYTLPNAEAGNDTIICPGTKTILGPDGSIANLEYSWTPANSLDDSQAKNPLASPENDTNYFLEVADTNGCKDTDSVKVSINPSSVINEGPDTSICFGDTIRLGGEPTAEGSLLPYNYKWKPVNTMSGSGSPNPLVWPQQNTIYELVTYTAHCPVDTSFVHVKVNSLPSVGIMKDTIVGYNEPFELWATGGESYEWFPGRGLDFTRGAHVTARLKQEQTYHVEVTNKYGCTDTRSVHIDIQNKIFVPELFTPNGDGRNDTFKIYGFGIKRLQLKIFTMEGELVYKTNNVEEAMSDGWDGTYKGKPLEAGKYIWILKGEKNNGDPIRFKGKNKGTVILIR
jgi:gliding motility-associated-like protein